MKNEYIKGRGAQLNTKNKYDRLQLDDTALDGIDDYTHSNIKTKFIPQSFKSIVNDIESPDLARYMMKSVNPYQGCEHGCIYCYARNSHEYWGYSAGVDFETKIIIKENAVTLLKEAFEKKSWKSQVISFSGNTDCYQPIEKKLRITRSLLELCLEYKNPVSIITKNALILRDIDILKELSNLKLVTVFTSITSLDENLRLLLEPRTTTYSSRLKVIEQLSANGIFTGVMVAPIIPGLNDHHCNDVLKAACQVGAQQVGYTIVRLNGAIGEIFKDWLHKNFPDRYDKVIHLIEDMHDGNINDSNYFRRMKGAGIWSEIFAKQFSTFVNKLQLNRQTYEYDYSIFKRPSDNQLSLF